MSFENSLQTPAYGEAPNPESSYGQRITEALRSRNVTQHIRSPWITGEPIPITETPTSAIPLLIRGTYGDILPPIATFHTGDQKQFDIAFGALPAEDTINGAAKHYAVFRGTDKRLRIQELTIDELNTGELNADPEKAIRLLPGEKTSIDTPVSKLTVTAAHADNAFTVQTSVSPLAAGAPSPYTTVLAHNPYGPGAQR